MDYFSEDENTDDEDSSVVYNPLIAARGKERRNYKNSLGNRYTFSQQDKSNKSKSQRLNNGKADGIRASPLQQTDILKLFAGLKQCCAKAGELGGCYYHHFMIGTTVDINAAMEHFQLCREITRMKNRDAKDEFIKQKFDESIKSHVETDSGNIIYNMEYRLPSPHYKHGRNDGIIVCKSWFAAAYGFSKYEIEKCSTQKKSSVCINGSIGSLRVSTYMDSHLHPFNYAQTREMIFDNLSISGIFLTIVV
jgi:hypothetical protein